jgi:protein SCO1
VGKQNLRDFSTRFRKKNLKAALRTLTAPRNGLPGAKAILCPPHDNRRSILANQGVGLARILIDAGGMSLTKPFFAASILMAALAWAGCSSNPALEERTDASRIFEVNGRLKSIGPGGASAVIEHEAIPDFMPAMTMPFYVKEPGELSGFAPGNAIRFRFVVTEDDSWIERIERLSNDAIALSPAGEAAGRTRISHRIPQLEKGEVVPNFRLINQDGERFQMSAFAGKHVVLTFIFIRCPVPNFCPLMSQNFRELRRLLDEAPGAPETQLISVTIDPAYDTPERLRIYAARYTAEGEGWTFATGSQDEIDELTARFAIYVEPEANTISHGLGTFHITPDGCLSEIWRGNSWTAQEVFSAINSEANRPNSLGGPKPLPLSQHPNSAPNTQAIYLGSH